MPSAGQITLVFVSIALFVTGGVISLWRLRRERAWQPTATRLCMWLGVLSSLIVLVWHALGRGSWLPLEDNFDALLWLAVVLAVFVMYVQRRRPIGGLDWFVMPIVILLLIGSAVTGLTDPHAYDVKTIWSWVHRATAYGGAAAFAVAGAAGAMYLIANHRLRRKVALASGPRLGSLERLEQLTLTSVTLGFALLTIGAITGFAEMIREARATPTAKIVLTAAVWLIYALVLHSPINPSFRGRRAAMLSILGFVLMLGVIFAVLLMPATGG
jgi:ABC-type uncharacterized transport system permease subunit